MTSEKILKLFKNISVWQRGDERAPHKPLLLLYALAKLWQGQRWLLFEEINKDVRVLLQKFGPPRNTSPIYPFQHLANDGLWEYYPTKPEHFRVGDLVKKRIAGGFPKPVFTYLKKDTVLRKQVILELLRSHFPTSLHEQILESIGLEIDPKTEPEEKISVFEQRVLKVYDYRCALCGFNVKIGNFSLALEAAHIKWPRYGGRNDLTNGLAFCSVHRQLFDGGAFTFIPHNKQYVCQVSRLATGDRGLKEWLWRYHDHYLSRPNEPLATPKSEYVTWHRKEVFRGLPISF